MMHMLDLVMSGTKGFDASLLAKQDVKNAVKTGLVGFAGLFGTEMCYRMMKRKVIGPCAELKYPTEAIAYDAVIRDAFVKLQNYAELSPYLFQTALRNIDSLLFLEHALVNKIITPKQVRDKQLAFANLRVSVSRLQAFQRLIADKLGNHHAFVANLHVTKIYEQARVHMLNIFHLCDAVDVNDLLSEAPTMIEELKRNKEW